MEKMEEEQEQEQEFPNETMYIPVTAGMQELIEIPAVFNQKFDPSQVVRTQINLDFDDQAFFLDGIMTKEECEALMAIGEGYGYGQVETDASKACTAKKVMVFSKPLTDLLFHRLLPFLNDIEINPNVNIHKIYLEGNSFAHQGLWHPHKLDLTMRLSRYTEGGYFAPHYDGCYFDPENPAIVRSMKTIVFYLNTPEKGCGGETAFLSDKVKDANGHPLRLAACDPIQCRALIFNHRTLHESVVVNGSVKYIIRSDVMFKRISTGQLGEKDLQAINLVNQAEQCEMENKTMEAVNLYRRAFRMSPLLADNYSNRDVA